MKINRLFSEAITNSGQAYLRSERALLAEDSLPTLKENLANPDPIARLIAKCLVKWKTDPDRVYQSALEYMEQKEKDISETPAMFPPPDGYARTLTAFYGNGLVELLAVRLIKCTDWPDWKSGTAVWYLRQHKSPSATSALIRTAARTKNRELRDMAIDAIQKTEDPDLREKMDFERKAAVHKGREWPLELNEMGMK